MTRIRSVAMAGLLPLLGMAPVAGLAQDVVPPPAYQPAQPPVDPSAPPPVDPSAQPPVDAAGQPPAVPLYTVGQLDQMLAPIALYPDALLTQILMASTYPIQIVEAERWLQGPNNAAIQGDALVNVLQPMPWDPSVKSLVPFPQLVKQLNDNLDWTQSLGNAFANQQADVMAQVQVLRQQAESAGKLTSTAQLRVVHEGPAVVIEPANPAVVYVPVYNPVEVYGPWAYAEYPPLYFPPLPGFYVGPVGIGIGFSVGFGVVGPLWGWGHPSWGERNIVINNSYYSRISYNHAGFAGSTWHHSGPVGFVGGAGFHGAGAAGFHGAAGAAAFHGPSGAGGFRGAAGSGGYHAPGGTAGFRGATGAHGSSGAGGHGSTQRAAAHSFSPSHGGSSHGAGNFGHASAGHGGGGAPGGHGGSGPSRGGSGGHGGSGPSHGGSAGHGGAASSHGSSGKGNQHH